jgi:patatin-like phospholipase/acyl hydrolase
LHNFRGAGNDRSELAAKVGLYTAAAPTYFPSVDGFIDGGVYAANPAYASFLVNRELASKVQIAVLPLGTDSGVLGNIIQGAIGPGRK